MIITKEEQRIKRHRRIRKVVKGTSKVPRLNVFRSLRHLFVQLIDDTQNKTILSASDHELDKKIQNCKISDATKVGELIAKKALNKGVKTICFDRGGYAYRGQVKAVACGARKGGLKF